MAVYPPSYGVMIKDSIRETEASRLKTRGSIKTRSSDLQQLSSSDNHQPQWQSTQLNCEPLMPFKILQCSRQCSNERRVFRVGHTLHASIFMLHNTMFVWSVDLHVCVETFLLCLYSLYIIYTCHLMEADSAHQVGCITGSSLQPTTSGASFGSFTDAADSFMQPHTDTRLVHRQEDPSAFPRQSTTSQAWHPSQGSPDHQWPSTPECQASQGSVARPWPSIPHWQAPQGSSHQSWPASPQWAQIPSHQPVSDTPTRSTPSIAPCTQLPLYDDSLPNGNLTASSSSMQQPSCESGPYAYHHGSRQAVQEPPLGLDAGHAAILDHAGGEEDDADDNGFGDFAAADHAPHITAHAPAAATLQSADR